jgi:RND superfamily putative drug exporter
MALAIGIGMVVSVTLIPALLAILGPAALWSPRRPSAPQPTGPGRDTGPGRGTEPSPEAEPGPERAGRRWAWLLTRPAFAVVVLAVCGGGLVAAAVPLRHLALGVSFVESLPRDHPARQAAEQAQTGFAAGILAPTELLIQGRDVTTRGAELARLQRSLAGLPGVAAVLGPADDAIPEELNIFQAPDGTAARYLLVLDDEPLGARAVHTLTRLRDALPGLVRAAGLTGVRASLGGDTAIARVVVEQTVHDLSRIAIAALVANLLFLMLYLRALIVPVTLLACSMLAIAATLGLTTWLFQDVLGHDGLTFYVPFAAAVLLVALGSDYNIFGIGPAWREAKTRPLRDALAATLPQSARAIRIAGLTLAVSFGLLVIVPLRPFHELAFALSAGIVIDAFVVRSLLAPAALAVMESWSSWPGRQAFRATDPAVP